jgi:amino acid transporter
MNSDKLNLWNQWKNSINFKKQSLAGKLIFIFTVLVLGTIIVMNFLTISLGSWRPLGLYSIWILFGWLFFVVLVYITVKLTSMLMHKNRSEKQEIEQINLSERDNQKE